MVSDTSRDYASHYCSGYTTQLGNTHSIKNIDGDAASKDDEKPSEGVVATQPTNIYNNGDIESSTMRAECKRTMQLAPGAKRFQLLSFPSQVQERAMDAMTTFAYSYGDILSQPWSVEHVGSFLTARDLARLCSACGILGNTRGEYVRVASKAQHGYVQQEGSCLATLTYLKCLEIIPRLFEINDLDSMENSWMLRIPLRRGRYYLLVYGWTYRFQDVLDFFFNSRRIMPDIHSDWHDAGAYIYRCDFPDVTVEASGPQCLLCLKRPCAADAKAENIEHNRVRLGRICFAPT